MQVEQSLALCQQPLRAIEGLVVDVLPEQPTLGIDQVGAVQRHVFKIVECQPLVKHVQLAVAEEWKPEAVRTGQVRDGLAGPLDGIQADRGDFDSGSALRRGLWMERLELLYAVQATETEVDDHEQ